MTISVTIEGRGEINLIKTGTANNIDNYQIVSSPVFIGSVLNSDEIKIDGEKLKITSIGAYAFEGCTSLTTIDGFDLVKNIEQCAFYDCSSLTTIDGFGAVVTIGESAFFRCTSLTTIDGFDSVQTIGDQAFQNCYSLTYVNSAFFKTNEKYLTSSPNLFINKELNDAQDRKLNIFIGISSISIAGLVAWNIILYNKINRK